MRARGEGKGEGEGVGEGVGEGEGEGEGWNFGHARARVPEHQAPRMRMSTCMHTSMCMSMYTWLTHSVRRSLGARPR